MAEAKPEAKKKMNVMQLTVLVAVNMMGSGIIMLPTNMAKVGAISLLSWIVTAVGSMAIAYGFAQAGVLQTRSGGMAAYAEEAHGKSGFFMTFYLYFFSLAIGNVAIAISAVGYLATFFPQLSETPIATTMSVIALIWLTTVANFGGPKVTGQIGSITVWGVIIPVAGLSVIGWFWFSPETFTAAWNPHGMHFSEGLGSSIALTLWAFLGMESAAQNSDAVENPKRDVPLACLLGTLGAAVVYVLSTTVIQGIVPNAELAESTGPFGLVYVKMFNPMVGSIIMGLAVMACLGSLLGWQFTIAMTGKSAAEDRMFPAFFTKVNSMGAPIQGMLVMGVVQTGLALMTISPSLSEQFGALVSLAVVTNVVPYIMALTALVVMMRKAGTPLGTYRLNVFVSVIAVLYSIYAIYASGMEAVLGGMLVMGVGYLIYGFLAPRFELPGTKAPLARTTAVAAGLVAAALLGVFAAGAAAAGTLDRVRETGAIRLGYLAEARPFSYRDEAGKPAGYAVALCDAVVADLRGELGMPGLRADWVLLEPGTRFEAVRTGIVDLLCGGGAQTLTLREKVDFSIPIFPGGIGALVRADAPDRLRRMLAGEPEPFRPNWRASLGEVMAKRRFAVVANSRASVWLAGAIKTFGLQSTVEPVDDFATGVERVATRRADVMFGEREILLDAVKNSPAARELMVVERKFTLDPIAFALPRGDADFRLAVDRALSRAISQKHRELYVETFGQADEDTLRFFRQVAIPE